MIQEQLNSANVHILELYRKNEYGDPQFLCHDSKQCFLKMRKQNWHKSMFSFLAILLNCTDWAITGRIAHVQIKSTLESAFSGTQVDKQYI